MNDPAPRLEPAPTLQIGEWRFEHTRNELSRAGTVHRLPRREVELLLRLAASPGETVSREQLLTDVWTRRMVNDEVLSRAIADLRQVLDDDAREPRYIETIPKVGYRLVAAVRDAAEPVAVARPPAAGTATQPDPASSRPRPVRLAGIAAALALVLLAAFWWLRSSPGAGDPLRVENLLRAQPFTSDPGWELSPRFTPDGRSVLYSKVETADASDSASIWIRALDGSLSEKLVDDGKWNLCPTPSPDGARVAWLSMERERCTLVERALLGGAVRELAACARGLRACPDWSPDGSALLYTAPPAGPDRGPALMRVDVATLATTPVTTDTPRDMADLTPRLSPDGQQVAFQRGNGWGGLYYVVASTGGSPRALGTRAELNYGLAWTSDGRRLLLATDAVGYRALVAQDVASGEMRLLGARGARYPDVSRQGALVWEHAEYDANLWLVGLGANGAAPRQLTTARRYDAQPEYSPDGTRVAFMSNRDGAERIYLLDLATGAERGLATPDAERWTQVAWAPDGTALTAIHYEATTTRGCVYVLASSHAECPEALRGFESLRLAADGTYLALRGTDAHRDLYRITRDGTATLLSSGVERFLPRGERLLIQRRDQPGIVLREADGSERVLAAEFGVVSRGLWSATGEALFLAASQASGRPPGLYRLAFANSEPERVSTELPDTIGPALTIAPDERHAVLGRTDRLDVDLHWIPPPR